VEFTQLLDPLSAAIVIGGTLAATLLRCGWRDARAALAMLAQVPRRPFDSGRVRAELAAQVREIGEDGILRAEPHRFGDGEFDDLSEALIRHRSIKGLFEEHERHRTRRQALAQTATRVLGEAAELAPVLGLAGTLFALGGYAPGVDGDYARSIGTAVVTTLYGLVLANFVFAPLVGAVVGRGVAVPEGEEQPARRATAATRAAAARAAARSRAIGVDGGRHEETPPPPEAAGSLPSIVRPLTRRSTGSTAGSHGPPSSGPGLPGPLVITGRSPPVPPGGGRG